MSNARKLREKKQRNFTKKADLDFASLYNVFTCSICFGKRQKMGILKAEKRGRNNLNMYLENFSFKKLPNFGKERLGDDMQVAIR